MCKRHGNCKVSIANQTVVHYVQVDDSRLGQILLLKVLSLSLCVCDFVLRMDVFLEILPHLNLQIAVSLNLLI